MSFQWPAMFFKKKVPDLFGFHTMELKNKDAFFWLLSSTVKRGCTGKMQKHRKFYNKSLKWNLKIISSHVFLAFSPLD